MKVGQKVIIKNFGKVYTTRFDTFKSMGFKDPEKPKGIYNDSFLYKDTIFEIFSREGKFVGIQDEKGNQFLFSKKGLKLINSKLIYVASPYSHPVDDVRIENYKIVSNYTAKIVSDGNVAFSPITYGHHLVDFKDMPTDWDFWKNFCLTFLSKCDEMVVLKMPGWEESRGVKEEIEFCKKNKIKINYVEL